jgi:Sec-independent protein translocase protein TatA
MLSLPDMAILSVLALLVFGEQKLPGIMRLAGRVMREVQNTSQSFIREMERAADVNEPPSAPPPAPEEPPKED